MAVGHVRNQSLVEKLTATYYRSNTISIAINNFDQLTCYPTSQGAIISWPKTPNIHRIVDTSASLFVARFAANGSHPKLIKNTWSICDGGHR